MLKRLTHIYADILHIYIKYDDATIEGYLPNFTKAKLLLKAHLNLVKNFLLGFRKPDKNEIESKKWFFVIHKNNIESLDGIFHQLEDSVYISTYKLSPETHPLNYSLRLLYIWYFPVIFFKLYKQYGKITLKTIHVVFLSVGLYEVSIRNLRKYRPSIIVIANDHSPSARALLIAAKELGIKTVYVPHGSTSCHFPPLTYSLSLLEGQNMLDQYRLSGEIKSIVKLIGCPKFDTFINHKNKAAQVSRIGICTNSIDETSRIVRVIKRVRENFPSLLITYRQHPSDTRDFILRENIPGVVVSDCWKETALTFLQNQDLIIAGDSSIHQEACYLNVVACYYPMHDHSVITYDYYGFVARGLLKKLENEDMLLNYISANVTKKEDLDTSIIQYYNAAIGSSFEGESTGLAVRYINELIQN